MPTPLSAEVLLSQKSCCGNECRNCPYQDEQGRRHQLGSTQVAGIWQKWVLFDFDGTLANSLALQKDALQELTRRHGWPELTEPEFQVLRQGSLKEALKIRKISLWRVPFLAREGKQIIKDRWLEVRPFPGIEEMLHSLKHDGYQLGILTSNTKEAVETVLQHANIRAFFSVIVAEPKLWGKAKRLKQLIAVHNWNPHRIWYVGDEIRDLEAAQEAHVQALGVAWGLNTAEALQSTQSAVVTSPKELVHWIQINSATQ